MLSKPTRQTNLSPSPHFLSPFPDKKRQPLPLSKPPLHSRFSNLDYLSSLFHKTSPNHHSPSILETMSSKVSLLNISKERLSEQIKNYEFAGCAVVVYTAVICVSIYIYTDMFLVNVMSASILYGSRYGKMAKHPDMWKHPHIAGFVFGISGFWKMPMIQDQVT